MEGGQQRLRRKAEATAAVSAPSDGRQSGRSAAAGQGAVIDGESG